MDIMTISSKMLTGIISMIITKAIKKQIGQECKITVNEIKMTTEDGIIGAHLDIDASISPTSLQNLLKSKSLL